MIWSHVKKIISGMSSYLPWMTFAQIFNDEVITTVIKLQGIKLLLRRSLSRLFRDMRDEFLERMESFIGTKYDIMIQQLQVDANLQQQTFTSTEHIVDFLCEQLAAGGEGSRIMIPEQIRRNLKESLTVRSR